MAIPTPGVKTIVQFIRISCHNFLYCCLIVWFILSIFPLDCGLHRVCKSHLICKNFETSQIISTTKWGPLSDENPSGTQNLGISFNNVITTSLALLVWHGKLLASLKRYQQSTINIYTTHSWVILKIKFANSLFLRKLFIIDSSPVRAPNFIGYSFHLTDLTPSFNTTFISSADLALPGF